MASDSVNLVAQLGGETVTYTPHGGAATTFLAIVERRPTQVQSAGGNSYPAKTIELLIPNDATDGVTSIKERMDRVAFKKNLDDAAETTFTVTKVIQEDAGLITSDGGLFRVLVQA